MECCGNADEAKKKYLELIKEVGWAVVGVPMGERGPFMVYTIGLEETFDHPELVVFGLAPEIAHQFFHILVKEIKAGNPLKPGEKYTDLTGGGLPMIFYPLAPEKVSELRVLTWFVAEHAKKKKISPPLQMIWSDPAGLLPWEENFDEQFKNHQPMWWKTENDNSGN